MLEAVFSMEQLRGYTIQPTELSSVSAVESSAVESRQLWDTCQRVTARKQSTLLEAVTRQPVNTQQTEKT
jgi:hypothetical protein